MFWNLIQKILLFILFLVGQHEGLNQQPFIKDSDFRHICITDDKNLKSDEW